MNYQVMVADDSSEMEEQVLVQIKNGWKPQGGVSVAVVRYVHNSDGEVTWDFTYAQAMVKE